MSQHFLTLDFGSGQISAALGVYDENTGTFRVRNAVRVSCPSVSACYILDFDQSVRALRRVFEELGGGDSFAPTVAVGLRGDFLSFRRAAGSKTISGKNFIITEQDVHDALEASALPMDESLEVVDIFPQGYAVDGKFGVSNPVGLAGQFLDAETFVSCGLRTHLTNLNRVMTAAGCEEFEAVPTVLALCGTLLKEEEKQGCTLLLDIGAAHSSAALYYKGMLEGAWEMPLGADFIVQEVADVLQNDLKEARAVLRQYAYGDDEILDDVLDEAARKLLRAIQKELTQGSLAYIKHPPAVIVLTGGGADLSVKNAAKRILGARRARIAAHDELIADGENLLAPAYTSALSLMLHAQRYGGLAQETQPDKAPGFLDRMLAKLGLN